MNMTRSFKLVWGTWSLTFSVIVLIAVAVLGYISWRRRGSRPVDGWLEFLRWSLVLFGAILLNQPEYTEEFKPTDKPSVAVICDLSPSMGTKDVVDAAGKA